MTEHPTSYEPELKNPASRGRRDLLVIVALVMTGCVLVLLDPDGAFEWLASHRAVQLDEFLAAITVMGVGFAVFSWRRWTDLSRQVAEYKRLQIELSLLNREALRMSETDDLLQSCLSSEEAYKIVIRHFETEWPHLSGAIFAISSAHDAVEVVARWGTPTVPQESFAMKECWGLRRGRPHVSEARDAGLACAHIGSQVPVYALCLPMMAQGETLGFLYLDTKENRARILTDQQERSIKLLTEHLALAVANLNLRESLRTQSIRDPLTGLFNRRYMEESLERELRRATRKELTLAVLIADVDHFKRFNDTYGHEAGDAVLREMAKLFQMQLRTEDIASRFGGEEFLLILPETSAEAAMECAERLRQSAIAMRMPHYGEMLPAVNLSIGVALYPEHGGTANQLIHAADAALYKAKESGRNQVVLSGT